ncbi:LacI family DNA-binding transcriptional regulator [Terrabacter sp. Soil811]|uniref:LacI family DNA-binding transcriptional regulator n=1 Tax=Terrabacter sp. Soil811 TaxID=1736419 RepID=UPI000B330D3F
MGERRAVSMADVARLANVSSQTVSRVANGETSVVESTRQTVLRAMEELGYRPNSAARALKRGAFRAIGVMTFTLSTTGNVRTLEGIVAAAAVHDYAVTLIPVNAPSQDAVRGAFTRAGELAVDAVVAIMETHLASDAPAPYPPGFKVVVADSDDAGDRHPVVDTDQAAGAASATDHLLDLGHRTVWHVAGPESSYAAQRRRDAWRARLVARGLEVPRVLHGDWTPESGYEIGLRLADEPSCTAVFAANDQMALGLLRAFHDRGLRVPEQVSVVGFDDVPEAASYIPPLTTVRQDFEQIGRLCVEQVLGQVRGTGPTTGTTLVPTQLVVRASSAAPGRTGARRPRRA